MISLKVRNKQQYKFNKAVSTQLLEDVKVQVKFDRYLILCHASTDPVEQLQVDQLAKLQQLFTVLLCVIYQHESKDKCKNQTVLCVFQQNNSNNDKRRSFSQG
jgi:hypothetical protein